MKPIPAEDTNVIVLDDPEHGVEFSHRKNTRAQLAVFLEDWRWQWVIIGLVVLDALLVTADILIAAQTCDDDHVSDAVHTAEDAIRLASIAILSFFVIEWIVEAIVNGVRRWVRKPVHLVDIAIVCVSLGLEILAFFAYEQLAQIGGLLVIFRLWRVIRVSHAVKDVGDKNKRDHAAQLQDEICRLKKVQDAHHTVITELHHEYMHRMKNLRAAAEERYVTVTRAAAGAAAEAAAVIAEHDREDDTAAEKLLHKTATDDILSHMCRRNPDVRHAVALHIDSVHDRKNELEETKGNVHALPTIIDHEHEGEEGEIKSEAKAPDASSSSRTSEE